MIVKINAHNYKAFRERIRGDRLIKLINLMLRSAKCRLVRIGNLGGNGHPTLLLIFSFIALFKLMNYIAITKALYGRCIQRSYCGRLT